MKRVFDCETSRFPDANPYRVSARCISYCVDDRFSYYSDPDFRTTLQRDLDETTLLIGINIKFDIGWLRRLGCILPDGIRIWDCQLAEFVLSGQTNSFASMDYLCNLYGLTGKLGGLEEWWGQGIETADIPRPILEEYNLGDTSRTLQIYEHQLEDKRMTEPLKKLILLQGLDLLVLQEMEENGIFYDSVGSIMKGDEVEIEIQEIKKGLQSVVEFNDFNFDSGDHLSCLLYGGVVSVDRYSIVTQVYKTGPRKGQEYQANRFQETDRRVFPGLFKPLNRTALKKPGYYQTGEPILRQLPCRTKQQKFVISSLLRLAELSKQVGSFLHALPELCTTMEWGSTLHPTYNQCVARTGRLSCSKPNAQQFPEVVDKFWVSRYAS